MKEDNCGADPIGDNIVRLLFKNLYSWLGVFCSTLHFFYRALGNGVIFTQSYKLGINLFIHSNLSRTGDLSHIQSL